MDIKLKDAMLEYNHGGPVRVSKHPSNSDLDFSFGAAFVSWRKMPKQRRLLQLYIDAWHAVIRDNVPPEQVHEALMVIPEYRDTLAEDVQL